MPKYQLLEDVDHPALADDVVELHSRGR